jgi:hypothetical protein
VFKLRARKRTLGSLLAVATLALATLLVPPMTPTAHAAIDCPIGAVAGTPVDGFERMYSSHGVAMCHALDGAYVVAQVQIVDLATPGPAGISGARLSASGYHPSGAQPSNPADRTFVKKSISQWADDHYCCDAPDNIADNQTFSVTNASFFTDTSNPTTKLSLPYKGYVNPAYPRFSYGVAIRNTDPNSATPKMVLRMNGGVYPDSQVQIQFFPTIYSESDAQCTGWDSCVVGFDPLADVSGDPTTRNNRTFVATNSCWGVNASRAFILTGAGLTVRDAHDILQHFGACASMQLDGGGSTQMRSYAGDRLSLLDRHIPTVLFVNYAR